MKKQITFLLVILITITTSNFGQEITRVFPTETTGRISSVVMDVSGVGYALSSCEYLMITQDFGENWTEKQLSFSSVFELKIFPGTNGQKLVAHSTNRIYLSDDSGDTFENITPDGIALFNHVQLNNNGKIIIPSRSNGVFYSDDNGTNWSSLGGDLLSQNLFFVDFVTDLKGWIANTAGDVWLTNDGGLSWDQIYSDNDSQNYTQMEFINSNTGYRSGSNKLFKSTDGGISWSLHYEGASFYSSFLVLNDSTLFTYSGTLLSISKDGGSTWTQLARDPDPVYNFAFALNQNEIWRCGLNKGIAYSPDQGTTWIDQTGSIKENFYDIAFYNEAIGASAGNNGNILLTADGGSEWNLVSSGQSNLTGLIYNSKGELLISGSSVGIWKSSDMMNFVNVDNTGGTVPRFSVSPDGSVLFNFSQERILYSTDDGDSWMSLNENTDRSFRSFSAGSNQVFYIGTNDGNVISSSDGGQTWGVTSTGSSQFIRVVSFKDELNGFVISNDSVRITTDGTNSFTGISRNPQNILKMVMKDDSIGYAVGSSSPGSNQGYIYTTTDGWNTNTRIYSSCQGLSTMTKNEHTGEFWFAGNGGNIETTAILTTSIVNTTKPEIIDIKAFPNPSQGIINLDLPKVFSEESVINIFNINGVQLATYTVQQMESKQIKLNDGMYIIHVNNENAVGVAKVVIHQ